MHININNINISVLPCQYFICQCYNYNMHTRRCIIICTNIVLDDNLLKKAFKYTDANLS